jgi:hypothetical protein
MLKCFVVSMSKLLPPSSIEIWWGLILNLLSKSPSSTTIATTFPSPNALLTQHPRTAHEQRTDIPAQKPHLLRLARRDVYQTLRVRQVRVQLR